MKKSWKRGLVLVLILLQLLTLCGCKQLETMRKNQAFYGEGTDILWNGTTYKLLPECEFLAPELDYETTVWVTTDDVPVLLSAMLSSRALTPSEDGVILEPMYEAGFFCREDRYEDICARIQSFTPDKVCYSYDYYDEETGEYTTGNYTLTQEQLEAIRLVAETVEPEVLGNGLYLDYDWSVYLEECSEDMLFRRNTLDIAVSGDSYYLLLYTDTQTLAFSVPEGCNATFDEIVSAYRDAYWQFENDHSDFEI